jgi:hypothetical protein
MKTLVLAWVFFGLLLAGAFGQSAVRVDVKASPGATVGAKVAAAMAKCPSVSPCVLVLDASLSSYPAGTMPRLCSNCTLADSRTGSSPGFPGVLSDQANGLKVGGGIASGGNISVAGALTSSMTNGVVNPAACGSAAPPSWCSGSTLDAWIIAALRGPCGSGPSLGAFPVCQIEVPPSATPYAWNSTVKIPAATTTEQAVFALVFDRGAKANVSSSLSGDALFITGSIYEGEHVLLRDLHLAGGGARTTSAIHIQNLYGAYIIRPIINGFSSGAGIWLEGGGAEIEEPSIASSKYCVKLSSTAGQAPNAVHVRGGEFDACSYGWYHNDTAPGLVHLGDANSLENVTFEGDTTPVLDTASRSFLIKSNYMEAYTGSAVVLGGSGNATQAPVLLSNVLYTKGAASYSLNNVYNGVFGGFDTGSPTAFWTLSGRSSQNQIIGYTETPKVTPLGALGSGGTAACDTGDGFLCTYHYGVIKIVSGTGAGVGDAFQLSWVTPFSSGNLICTFQGIAGPGISVNQDGTFFDVKTARAYVGTGPSGTYKIAYTCGVN